MQFVHQTLAWGFLIAMVPVLIHLINMMRHRRVRWAAMEFLLQSYRKHRKWIWLKQLLLLLMRVAAIALVVAMLAGWVTREQWLSILGQRATHHFVLLDDSYSMSQRYGGSTAFDRAGRALNRIATQSMDQDSPQRFTLIRFSQAYGAGESGGSAGFSVAADFNAEPVGANFDLLLQDRRVSFAATQLAVGPRPALQVARQLMDASADENRIVYLLTDFRRNQWDNPAEIRELLDEMQDLGADIQLVGCGAPSSTNLTISELRAGDETRAAGVPLFVKLTVRNFGDQPVRNLPLKIRSYYYPPQQAPASFTSAAVEPAELPTVLIDEIPAGGSAVREAQVYFPQAGQHVVEALLPDDAVAADNRRWSVIDFPEGENVLVVDGHPTQANAYYLVSAFQPGSRAATGIRPEVKNAAFLRDTTPEALRDYRAVYLLDVDRLDDRAVENLQAYVADGGGLGLFLGEHANIAFYNDRFYQNGAGLFPLPLGRDDLLPPELLENTPDIEVSEHPIFRVFLGERNPLIRLVTVEHYWRPPEQWSPPADSTTAVVARLRNRQPLVVERQYGQGRVVAFLTSLAPQWNNWAYDPTFVVVLLKLQSYLASAVREDPTRIVGTPYELSLDAKTFRPDVVFVAPGEQPEVRTEIRRTAVKPDDQSPVMTATLGGAGANGAPRSGETDHSGVYEAWPMTADGQLQPRRWAENVDPQEGDLTATEPQLLLTKLEPVRAEYHTAEQFEYSVADQAGLNRSLLLMGLLICLLLGEQVLAYFASYHPPRGAGS